MTHSYNSFVPAKCRIVFELHWTHPWFTWPHNIWTLDFKFSWNLELKGKSFISNLKWINENKSQLKAQNAFQQYNNDNLIHQISHWESRWCQTQCWFNCLIIWPSKKKRKRNADSIQRKYNSKWDNFHKEKQILKFILVIWELKIFYSFPTPHPTRPKKGGNSSSVISFKHHPFRFQKRKGDIQTRSSLATAQKAIALTYDLQKECFNLLII